MGDGLMKSFIVFLFLCLSINAQTIDTLGYTTIGIAGNSSVIADRSIGNPYTATTSGTLQKAYFYELPIGAGTKIAMSVYLDDGDGAFDSGDTRVDTTDLATLPGTTGWHELPFLIGGTITSGSTYWVIIYAYATSPQAARGKRDAGLTLHTIVAAGWETSGHPATLPAETSTTADFRQSMYVTYQRVVAATATEPGYERHSKYVGF